MRLSRTVIVTSREAPARETSPVRSTLVRAGVARRGSDGALAWMPAGARAIRAAERLLEDAFARAGAHELASPDRESLASHARALLAATGRRALAAWSRFADRKGRRGLALAVVAQDSAEGGDEFDALLADLYVALERVESACRLSSAPGPSAGDPSGFLAIAGAAAESRRSLREDGDEEVLACGCGFGADLESCPRPSPADPAPVPDPGAPPMIRTPTPGARTIRELGEFFRAGEDAFVKTIVYRELSPKSRVARFAAACVRGDLAVSASKLARSLGWRGATLAEACEVEAVAGVPPGFVGPVGLDGCPVVCDDSVMRMPLAMCGGLEIDTHFERVVPLRDFVPDLVADIALAREGDPCPRCGGPLAAARALPWARLSVARDGEAREGPGNAPEGERFVREARGEFRPETLVEASVAADADGLVWPLALAPWKAAVVPVRFDGATAEQAAKLHDLLEAAGVPTLLDDRDERPGVKFKDADLVGYPFRFVIGDRNPAGTAELATRDLRAGASGGERAERRVLTFDECVDFALSHAALTRVAPTRVAGLVPTDDA